MSKLEAWIPDADDEFGESQVDIDRMNLQGTGSLSLKRETARNALRNEHRARREAQ